MITIPMRTPSPTRPAVTRKSELPPLAAGSTDAVATGDGLAAATTDRVGDATGLTVGAALVGAAVVGAALRDAVALPVAVGVAVAAAVAVALAVGAGDGVVVLVPSDAHARESLTPGADAHTERAGVTHELPSAAVRDSDTRMNG
jgi:hypothetical protein